MFGFEDSLKKYKKEWKITGVDMAFVKEWQKQYDKVRRQAPELERQYIQAKAELEKVCEILEEIELMMIANQDIAFFPNSRRKLQEMAKEMETYQQHFKQEFLIGKADTAFHENYEIILKLCETNLKDRGDRLILQSEVENMIAIIKEALEKEWPPFYALAFYYINHTDEEIEELPHRDKINEVICIYKDEFFTPIRQELSEHLHEKKVSQFMEVELWI